MVERRKATKRLRWAAAIAVLTAGGVTLFDRLRIRDRTKPPVLLTSGRGRPAGPPNAASLAHGYETADTDVRGLLKILALSVALIVGGLAVVFTMYGTFARHQRSGAQTMTPQQKAVIMPPEPRLQDDPYRDLNTMRMEQTQVLTTYGWADADHTQARIPIDRAMALIAGKPLDGPSLGGAKPAGATP